MLLLVETALDYTICQD